MKSRPAAFPKRREGDTSQSQFGLRMISFTDLMAVLLSFFILLYATRDPIPPQQLPASFNTIPAIVAQPTLKTESALAKPLAGLDLNYIAALLRQAQARDPLLGDLEVSTYPYSLIITMQNANAEKLSFALAKIALYRRTVQVFATPSVIDTLMEQNSDKTISYFPQEGLSAPRILIH